MKNIFSYDSKIMQLLGYVGDLFILNVIFLIFCLPVITIGPAQAGLFTAMDVLRDPMDDSSCVRAFFKGFKSGFGKISLVSTFFLILDILLLYTLIMTWSYQDTGRYLHWGISGVFLILCMLLHGLLPVFHARFNCGPVQLVRNGLVLLVMYPLRSVLISALIWAPLVLFLLAVNTFANLGALFITVYYSVAYLLAAYMLKKPFGKLMEAVKDQEAQNHE